jgi:hypothetical protein
MVRVATLLLVLACLACRSSPEPQTLVVDDPKWQGFLEKLPYALGPAAELEKRRAARGIPLRFRVGDGDIGANRDRVESDAYCGDVIGVFVRELPPPGTNVVRSEEVLELGPGGDVVERWPIPPDKPIVAIRGDEVFVPHGIRLPDARTLSVLLAIKPDGTFRVTARRSFTSPRHARCPDAVAAAEGDATPPERCQAHSDASGLRVLAYEGACLALSR